MSPVGSGGDEPQPEPPAPPVVGAHVLFDRITSTIKEMHSKKAHKEHSANCLKDVAAIRDQFFYMQDEIIRLNMLLKATKATVCLDNIQQEQEMNGSYANVVAGNVSEPEESTNENIIRAIIKDPKKPGGPANFQASKKFLFQTVKINNLAVGIEKVKPHKKNGVTIVCKNAKDVKIIEEQINKSTEFVAEVPTKRNPIYTFLIEGKGHVKEDVKEEVLTKNQDLIPRHLRNEVECLNVTETKGGNSVAVLRVPQLVYRNIKNNNK